MGSRVHPAPAGRVHATGHDGGRRVRLAGEHEGAQVEVGDDARLVADDAQRLAAVVAVQPDPGPVRLGGEP